MNSRFATLKALVYAGLMAAFCLAVKAQSGSEQSILYSAPDGQSVSNALLPNAAAPGGPQDLPNLPDAQPGSIFSSPESRPGMPLPKLAPKDRKTSKDNSDIRKSMGVETPAEAMGVPSLRDLFGLPKTKMTNSMSQYGDASTNILSSDSTAADDAKWSKILSADSDAFSTAKTADSNTLRGAFFDNSPSDNFFGEKKTSDEKADDDFDTSSLNPRRQPGQPVWDAAVQIAAPLSVRGYAPNAAPAPSAYTLPSLNSQSPFALPKVSDPQSTMPHLPTLPNVSGQSLPGQQPARPSWAPKPPPWLDTTPQMGTALQRNF